MLRDVFDYGLVTKSVILMFVMIIPFGIIHESGHAIICAVEGIDYDLHISAFGSSIICNGDVESKDLFHLMGGLLAFVIAITPYLLAKKQLEKLPYLAIVLLSLAVGHGVNAIVETVLFDSYITSNVILTFSINMVSMIAFIYFAHHYSKKTVKHNTPATKDSWNQPITNSVKTPDVKVESTTEKIVKQINSVSKAVELLKNDSIISAPTKTSRKVIKESKTQDNFGFTIDNVFDVNFSGSKRKGKQSFFGEPEW